jgi:hypothetical protein
MLLDEETMVYINGGEQFMRVKISEEANRENQNNYANFKKL